MLVPPLPVFFLLLAVGFGEFVFFAMILSKPPLPRAVLIVVPLVIVLVFAVVHAAVLLWARRRPAHQRHGHRGARQQGNGIKTETFHGYCSLVEKVRSLLRGLFILQVAQAPRPCGESGTTLAFSPRGVAGLSLTLHSHSQIPTSPPCEFD